MSAVSATSFPAHSSNGRRHSRSLQFLACRPLLAPQSSRHAEEKRWRKAHGTIDSGAAHRASDSSVSKDPTRFERRVTPTTCREEERHPHDRRSSSPASALWRPSTLRNDAHDTAYSLQNG